MRFLFTIIYNALTLTDLFLREQLQWKYVLKRAKGHWAATIEYYSKKDNPCHFDADKRLVWVRLGLFEGQLFFSKYSIKTILLVLNNQIKEVVVKNCNKLPWSVDIMVTSIYLIVDYLCRQPIPRWNSVEVSYYTSVTFVLPCKS